jgi:HTH-type transcriptional repressor of NAD biosynthesis genes
VIGPESTGKSTLTTNLAIYFNAIGHRSANIQEHARNWIDTVLGGDMDKLKFEHISNFGFTQSNLVKEAKRWGDFELIFSDTDAMVSTIFQKIYYGYVDRNLNNLGLYERWDLILFTQPDVPWVDDGQRNLGDRRQEINEMFKEFIEKNGSPYVIIDGNYEERFEKAKNAVKNTFSI